MPPDPWPFLYTPAAPAAVILAIGLIAGLIAVLIRSWRRRAAIRRRLFAGPRQ
jgi:hypothetical protein